MAMQAFDDPDDLLAGTEPVPEEIRPTIHRAQLEPGEKVDTPWQPGDPLDLPTEGRPRSGRPPRAGDLFGGRTAEEVAAALPLVPLSNGQPKQIDPPPLADPEAERLDRLRYLARWVGPTTYAQQRYDAARLIVDDWPSNNPKSKRVPPAQLAHLAGCRATLDDCLERDALAATRSDECHCLGSGGYDGQVALILLDPETVGKPVWERRILYSEGLDGPMTWSRICAHCPEGRAHLEWVAEQREGLKMRHAALIQRRILGQASIPARFEHLTLATYPDQAAAGKAQSWYLRVLGEIPTPIGLNHRKSLLIHGPNRRGKTGLAIGIQKLALERGVPAVFRSLRDLLADLRRAFGADANTTFDDVLDALRSAPLLIVDDIGAERLTRGDSWVAEVLYGLLDHRCNANLPTIMTSNLGWTETDEVGRRRALAKQTLEGKAWKATDYDPEELLRYVGERLWWRIDSMTNKLPLFGPVLGYDTDPSPVYLDPSDEL